jgi:hypothetical protein
VKVELHVVVCVKILNSVGNLLLLQLSITILSQILANLLAIQHAFTFSVNPLKGSIRLEMSVGRQLLPLLFNGDLIRPKMMKQGG